MTRTAAVKEAQPELLSEALPTTGLAQKPAMSDLVATFERFATDPNVSVEKIERLMALFERTEAKRAELAFNAAMATAQQEMKSVAPDAYNPQTQSRYASYEALDNALRPVYTKHGFGLTFNTGEGAPDLHVRVLCDVIHVGGFSKPYHLDMPADGKGAKGGDVMTRTHATGSALTYGQRYLLKMVWGIPVGKDDDGNKAGNREPVTEPEGFSDWFTDMELVAESGLKALSEAWNTSKGEFKNHVAKHLKRDWEQMKAKARRVKE